MKRVLLVGAGLSAKAGVPMTLELAQQFIRFVEESKNTSEESKGLLKLLKEIAIEPTSLKDIEWYMANLDFIISASDPEFPPSYLLKDGTDFKKWIKFKCEAEELRKKLFECIIQEGRVIDVDKVKYLEKLPDVFTNPKKGMIFSLNYDTVIERLCTHLNIKFEDGFEQEFNDFRITPQTMFTEPQDGIRLFKMHGSVTWFQTQGERYVKNLHFAPPDATEEMRYFTGESQEPLLVYPHEKGNPDWPYPLRRMRDHLTSKLFEIPRKDRKDPILWIAIGYSFRDRYITQMLLDVARMNEQFYLMIISPSATRIAERISKRPDGIYHDLYHKILPVPSGIETILPVLREKIDLLARGLGRNMDRVEESRYKFEDLISGLWPEKALEILQQIEWKDWSQLPFFQVLKMWYSCLLLHVITWPERKTSREKLVERFEALINSFAAYSPLEESHIKWRCGQDLRHSVEDDLVLALETGNVDVEMVTKEVNQIIEIGHNYQEIFAASEKYWKEAVKDIVQLFNPLLVKLPSK